MLSAASAGEQIAISAAVNKILMFAPLERVRAMRAEAVDVLQEHLVVGHPEARPVRGELQPDAAELAGTPVDHQRVALWVVIREQQWRVCRGQPDAVANSAVIKLIPTVADAPLRHELVDALQVPTRLLARIVPRQRVEGQCACLLAPEIFALQLEVGDRRIAARRPLQDEVGDPEIAAAGEGLRAERVHIWNGAILWRSTRVRQSRAPRGARADVAADMGEGGP